MLRNLISKMKFFYTNFKFHVETINSTSEEVNDVINNLASRVPLAVRMGDSYLPLHLYSEVDDENEMLDNLGTIVFGGNFSASKMSSKICLALANSNLSQIYLNGIVLDDCSFGVSPKCTSLNSLQLLNCYINDITRPDGVTNVLSFTLIKTASLKHLNLSTCKLKTKDTAIILEALKQVVGIKTIAISGNNLSEEVSDIFATVIAYNGELQCVEISNCNLQKSEFVSITKALENCKELQSLDFSSNVITDDVVANVAVVIEKCHLIKDLRLQNCQLQYAGVQKIIESMVKKTCLNYIDFSDNAITDQCAANVIINNRNLRKLSFSNCKLQSTGCHQLFQAMAKITSLVYLDLSKNLITDVAVDSFASIIHQNSGLEYLNISGCFDIANDFEKVTRSLVILKLLTHLDLSCNVINYASADNIAIIISNNAFLEDLDLSQCEIQKFTFPKIIIALQNIHHLKYLYLNSNAVVYEEATEIATVVSKNPFLEKVVLSSCNLTEKEMKAILSSLRNHTSLQHIDISSNTITNHVVNDIVDVIDSNTQLTHLNISDSDIQEYGVLKIFKAIRRINTLKCIKMCNCTISDRAAKDIANALSVNCMVEELVFTNNNFHETGIALLFDVLKEAHTLKSLSIAYNNAISNVTTKLIEVVSNNHIAYFDLSNCDLQESSCLSILNTLILQAPNLQHIDLSDNNLSGTAETIAQLISVSYYLHHLNLANTLMQDEEVMTIITAMQSINSLRYVDLTSYSVNDELSVELQSAIHKNPAMISFQLSKLFLKENTVTVMTFSKSIFSIVRNLQEITICFTDCENKQVDTVVTLIKNNPYLEYLHLENCSMLEIDISSIIVALSTTTTLVYVCLINFVITDEMDDGIATVLESNIQLKHFKLEPRKITEKGLTKSIQSFSFTSLSHLLLSKLNYLISDTTRQPICNSLTHLTLSDVCLDTTKLSYLSLPALTKLQHLNLSHNPLTDESANILSSVIFNNNSLQHLDLCDCKLQSEGIRVVADSLQAINVNYLDMSLNTTNVEIFNNNLMPALLSNLNLIEYLYLPYCELMPKEIEKIYDLISKAVNLKCVDVGPSAFSKSMVSKCKDIIFVSEGLKYITFSTEGIIKQGSLTNYETEKLYHSLHYLSVNDIIVDDRVGDIVAGLIANLPKLEHLEMAGDKWNITNVMKCFSALQNNHLKYLDLSNNYIDDEAVDYLTALIAANVGLEYVNFCNCKLSPSGVQSINNALKVTSSLKFLDICFTDSNSKILDDEQVVALLTTNKYLEHIALSNLVLDNTKLNQIQSHLCVIKGLRRLIINDVIFTDEDTNTIISLIANNPKLRELTLLDCEILVKSKLKFTFVSAALDKQYLKLDTITITNPRNKYSLNTLSNTPLHCNVSKLTLTDNDVVAVTTVDNNLGELIMFKLILNQKSLKVLSVNAVTIRYLKVLHIQDCTFTDYYAHYVASLITNNATTIQSFSLISCRISMKQKMMITKALCKLDIILLQYLNIKDIVYNAEFSTIENFTKPNTNCKLTDDIIAAAMTDHINLMISKLVINPETLAELKSNLNAIKGVIHLTINDCIFDVEIDKSLTGILTNNHCIQKLVLSNCSFPCKFSEVFMGLSFLQTLKLISFEKICYFQNLEDVMISIITNNPGLSQFTLCRCEITESALVKILRSIAEVLRNLLYINFINIKCSCKVVNHIATVISCNTELKHINLCNCQLLTMDVKSIIQTAKNLTTLEYFDLSCNQVTDYLANDIITLIANNNNIKEVNLPNYTLLITNYHLKVVLNTVTDILVNDIATIIMATNKSITKLSLLNCTLNNDQLMVVLHAVKECSVLPCINFTIEEIANVTGRTKVFNLLVLKNIVFFHQNSDLVKFRGTHHLSIVGCSFDFEEWKVLKHFLACIMTLNTLILQDCQLYGTISEIVEVCTHLSYLDLTNVKIAGSSKLRSVWLSRKPKPNKLGNFSLNLMDFTEEMMLDILNILYSSKIIDHFAMVKCNIDECRISSYSLWTECFACRKLLHLDLSYSRISGELVDCILAHITFLPNCIKIASCGFDKKDVSLVCNGLSKLYNIVHLNLNHNNNICYYASEIAAVIIRNKRSLRHIEMAECNFDINGILKICKSICSCTRLQNINLSHNEITGDAIDVLVSALCGYSLECINLQNCKLTSASSKNIIMALKNTTTLKSVDLSLNEMAEDSAVDVAGIIANNKDIKVLCLPDCVTSAGSSTNLSPAYLLLHHMVKGIFDHIKGSKSLRRVEFGSSRVNDILAEDVAAITSGGLVVVKFSELVLTNSGFKQLINSVLIMEGLNSISITGVHFTNTESYHLATLINNNKSVKSFDISNCVMSDKAKNIIFDAMINLTSLMSLYLKNIVFSGTVEDKVLVVITNNTSLEYLEVTGCEMNAAKLNEVTVCSSFSNLKVVSE